MARFQKGQGVVEFAFVLPFLLMIVMGLIYFGCVFSDYVALNNIAREIAREAAVMDNATYKANYESEDDEGNVSGDGYSTIRSNVKSRLPNTFYLWDPTNPEHLQISYESDGSVKVVMKAELNREANLGAVNYLSYVMSMNDMTVTYYMHSEVAQTTN